MKQSQIIHKHLNPFLMFNDIWYEEQQFLKKFKFKKKLGGGY